MSDHAWEWRERGTAVVVDIMLGGALRVEVNVDGWGGRGAELPPRAIVELAEWLDAASEHGLGQRLAEVEAECAEIEEERDAALQRVQGLERDIERMRAASQSLAEAYGRRS